MKTHLATSNATPNPDDICNNPECGHPYYNHQGMDNSCVALTKHCPCQHFTPKQREKSATELHIEHQEWLQQQAIKQSDLGKEGLIMGCQFCGKESHDAPIKCEQGKECPHCGGIHFGGAFCPYTETSSAPKANEQVGAKDLEKEATWPQGMVKIQYEGIAATPSKISEDEVEKSWSHQIMVEINKLTPDIKGKAFDVGWFLLRQMLEQKDEQTSQLKAENERLKAQLPCPIRGHFCACPNCEPVMCCNGQECGCQGLPVDFIPTDKCDGYCLNKTHRDLQAARLSLAQKDEALRKFKELYPNSENIQIICDKALSTPTPDTAILKQFEVGKEDGTLITIDALTKLGFKAVESDMGSNYPDHYEIGCVNIWEFNDSGKWLFNPCDNIEMTTIGQLKSLCNLMKQPLPTPHQGLTLCQPNHLAMPR